jgi:hypothetical protein
MRRGIHSIVQDAKDFDPLARHQVVDDVNRVFDLTAYEPDVKAARTFDQV